MFGDIFDYHDWQGQGCYWYLLGRDQGCCYTSYNAEDFLSRPFITQQIII